MKASKISEARLRVIFSEGYPLGAKRVLKAADLAPYPIIGYGSQTPYGMVVNRALSAAPKPIRFNAQVRFTPNAWRLVQAGAGIAIVDDFALIDNAWPNIHSRPLVQRTTTASALLAERAARSFVRDLMAMVPTATDPAMLD